MQEFVRYFKKRFMRFVLFPLKLVPIKRNRIFIHNDLSGNYSANPRYVAEYLLKHYPGRFQVIFSVKQPEKYKQLKLRIKFVRFNSVQYFWYAMTTKVFVSNSGGYSYLPLRKTQYVINTHHGGGAYKTCGKDMFEDTYLFRKDLLLAARQTDVFLSTCKKFTSALNRSNLIPLNRFWEIGMPRNDILVNGNTELRVRVRKKLGLHDGEYLVLFAPTYRKPEDNYFKESIAISYGIDCGRVCKALKKRFGGEWKFGFRLHPCVTNRDELPKGNIIDLSDYEEMQELILAADVMINDFSSSMWDFMLTGKPCFTYAVDLEHYARTTKLYTPVSEWPFPKSVNNDELEKNILDFDEKKYRDSCKRHYESLGGCETGKATKLVCRRIYEVCYGKGQYRRS